MPTLRKLSLWTQLGFVTSLGGALAMAGQPRQAWGLPPGRLCDKADDDASAQAVTRCELRSPLADLEFSPNGMVGSLGAIAVTRNPSNLAFSEGFEFSLRTAFAPKSVDRLRGSGLGLFAAGALAGPVHWGIGAQYLPGYCKIEKQSECKLPLERLIKVSTALALHSATDSAGKVPRLGLGIAVDTVFDVASKEARVVPNLSFAWRSWQLPVAIGLRAAMPIGQNTWSCDENSGTCVSFRPEVEFEGVSTPLSHVRVRGRRWTRTEVELGFGALVRPVRSSDVGLIQMRVRGMVGHPALPFRVFARAHTTPVYVNEKEGLRTGWGMSFGLAFEARRFSAAAAALLAGSPSFAPEPLTLLLANVDYSRLANPTASRFLRGVHRSRYQLTQIQLGRLQASDRELAGLVREITQAADRGPAVLVIEPFRSPFSWAQTEEIRDALVYFRRKDERNRVVAYLEGADLKGVFLAGTADWRLAHPVIEWTLRPPARTLVYWGEVMATFGISLEIIRTGAHKAAHEMHSRTVPSSAMTAEIHQYQSDLWNHVVQRVALDYGKQPLHVAASLQAGVVPAAQAMRSGWADELVWPNEAIDAIERRLAPAKFREAKMNPLVVKAPVLNGRPQVAVVYIDGFIADPHATLPSVSLRSSVSADQLHAELRRLTLDSNVRAVVLRIDSPGGDVVAVRGLATTMSQLIEAKGAAAAVVASVGDSATSGGYFLANAAGYVFAPATAHVGAVGALEVKLDLHRLLDKLGIGVYTRGLGKHAAMHSWCLTRNTSDRAANEAQLLAFHHDFVDALVRQRRLSRDVAQSLSQGASWSGVRGLALGLVDRYGGLLQAVDYAAAAVGLHRDEYDLVEVEVQARTTKNSHLSALAWAAGLVDPRLGHLATLVTRLPGLLLSCGQVYYFGGTAVFADEPSER